VVDRNAVYSCSLRPPSTLLLWRRIKARMNSKKTPWIYVLKRRLLLSNISSLEMSKLSDNFVLLKSPTEHDNLIECKRKTEFMGTLLKYGKSIRVSFSNMMELGIKGNKKKPISFERGGGREEVKFKGGKASVGDGLPADSVPSLKAPEVLPVQQVQIVPKMNASAGAARGPLASPQFKANDAVKAPTGKPAALKTPTPVPKAAGPRPTAKALYDFDAGNDDELTFREGDVMIVKNNKDSSWWDCELNGVCGKVPANYLGMIKAPAPVVAGRGKPMGGVAKPPVGSGGFAKKPAGRGRGY